MSSSGRLSLNRSAHSRVANSTPSQDTHVRRRWITSRPLHGLDQHVVIAATDPADGWFDTGFGQPTMRRTGPSMAKATWTNPVQLTNG